MSSRRRLLVVLVLLGLCLATGAERGGRWLRSRYLLPTHGAQWIWVSGAARAARPVAVWAVRDFDVGETPPTRSRLLISADEEYLVYVNGRLIGAGDYVPEAPLDEIELDDGLQSGWNRIAVELRSARGAGGLLASVFGDGADDEPLVRSDGSWRIYRRELDGLAEGWLPLDGGEPARVWAEPPTGRWRAPSEIETAPALGARLEREREALRVMALHRPCPPDCESGAGTPARAGQADSAFLVDFGVSAVGFVEIELEAAPGLSYEVRLADSLRELIGEGTATVLQAIPLANSRLWRSSRAARFRYAMVLGVDAVSGARILEVKEEWRARELARGGEEQGLFGITPRSE